METKYIDIEETITFDPANLPSQEIYDYAKTIYDRYQEIWEVGNREDGEMIFIKLGQVVRRGSWLPEETGLYKKWQSYVLRHKHDYRIVGVVSMLKRLAEIERGFAYMKTIIEKEMKQQYRPKY